MTTPKAVVFDLGKVLLDFDYTIAARNFALRARMAAQEITHFLSRTPLLLQYESGLITTEQFYKEICAATGFCGDPEEFAGLFGDIFAPIEPMVQLQSRLRQRGLPTYIFSNTNELAIRFVRRAFPFFHDFDGYILSFEHGAMKPDAKLYEVVERYSGRRGAEILYLDDRLENIAAGAVRGWQVILQGSPEATCQAVQRLGLL
ncbi:MAG TPA: HAD family phosphatase [Bacillota bacterium]|nr:HAD family phosphatase [Bacillota bacterium]